MRTEQSETRGNGVFYTPESVARELAIGARKCTPNSRPLRVLDPSCGDGVLLRLSRELFGDEHTYHGCDIFSPASPRRNGGWKFVHSDFFEYPISKKYDVVVTNPPYVRSGQIPEARRAELYERYLEYGPVSQTCDLWVYFVVKACRHLRPGGTVSAVLPWSFFEADYALPVRRWLAERFASIEALVLRDRHFRTTGKQVVLVWMSGYAQGNASVRIGLSDRTDSSHAFVPVDNSSWENQGVIAETGLETASLLSDMEGYGFQGLGSYATVLIGVVTGANEYFVLSERVAEAKGFSQKARIPILTSAGSLSGLYARAVPERTLIQFPRVTLRRAQYVELGEKQGLHLRSQCKRRCQYGTCRWYEVDPGPVPDAFFTYRVSDIPYLVLNPRSYQCTNALHKVCFTSGVTSEQRKWIALSIVSDLSQLSLERNARHYGNGMLKTEPSALKQALVYAPPKKKCPADALRQVSKLLSAGKKREASKAATAALRQEGGIPVEFCDRVHTTLSAIRARRL